VDLDSQGFNVVGTISSSGEIRQVELNLIPSFIQSHGHSTNEGLHSCSRLVVGSSESSSHTLVIKDLNFESKVFLQVLDNHDQERELDAQVFFRVGRGSNESSGYISTHDLQDTGLDIGICESLDVTISDLLVPNLKWFRSNREEDREETRLEGILEHDGLRRINRL